MKLRVLLNRYALASGFSEWDKKLTADANAEYYALMDVLKAADTASEIAPSGDWQIFEDDNNVKLLNLKMAVDNARLVWDKTE